MADVTELRCWPSCVDALDWSNDGIIALASDERVELLFPNTESFDTEQEAAQWRHLPLQVPWFSTEELPIKDPAPNTTYSIGEEISSSSTVAIAWSPPGLAKHRRSALATLTSNLVLSIWAADGKPHDESSWDRRVIVNNALTEHFVKHTAEEKSHLVSDIDEKARLRTRVRAFSWAPSLPSSHDPGCIGTQLEWGPYIMAISNDDNQVALVAIDSPTSTLGVEQGWNSRVITHFSVQPDSKSIFAEPGTFGEMMKQQRYMSYVAWSPWIIQGNLYRSVVAYATNEDVRARVVTYSKSSVTVGEEVIYPDIELRHAGPMKWLPQVEDGDKLILTLFTTSSLVLLSISGNDASIIEHIAHHLDGRWDPISGIVWDLSTKTSPRIHFCSLTSTLHSPTSVLEISKGELLSCDSPSWRDQITNNLILFSVQNDLKGNTKAKVWGLSASPLGDFVAAIHSVHPSDMIEYGPPSDRRSLVAINSLQGNKNLRTGFPVKNISAEGIVFTLKKWLENTVEDSDSIPAFVTEVRQKMMEAYRSPSSHSPNLVDISGGLDTMVSEFKKAAFLDCHSLEDRYTNLISQICPSSSSNALCSTLIAYRLATAVSQLPSSLSQSSFSSEILTQHRQVVDLINKLTSEEMMDIDKEDEDAEGEEDDEFETTPIEPKPTGAIATYGADTCDFCSAPIPFTDLTTAMCTSGHKSPRCGLTFLAIQAPGITKYCGICSTPFLSDEFVAAQEAGSREGSVGDADGENPDALGQGTEHRPKPIGSEGNTAQVVTSQNQSRHRPTGSGERRTELPNTLARVLFLACDACIYCGGRYVG